MNIMNKLTLKHVKQNRRRTILTIIGIILSVAMFTAVSTGKDSCLKWMERLSMEDSGKWQVEYKNVPADKLSILQKDEGIEVLSLVETKGYATVDGMDDMLKEKAKNQGKHYLYLSAYNDTAFENMPIKLVEGHFPKNENEIVVPNHMLEGLTTPYKIGDTITVEYGQRQLITDNQPEELEAFGLDREKPIEQSTKFLGESTTMTDSDGNSVTVGENFQYTGEKKQYTIVGIIDKPNFNTEFFNSPGYTVLTGMDVSALLADQKINAYIYLKNATTEIYDDVLKKAKEFGIVDNSETNAESSDNVQINDGVLYYSGVTPNDNFNRFNKVISLVLNIIIIVGSVSLIYNSFAISISQRSKQLGMLSSVGATKKQKRNSVFFEAFLYAVIGIPLGILAGIFGLTVTFKLINPLFTGMIDTNVELSMFVTAKSVVIPVILAIITIFISTYIPAKRASKIAPIEAIRQSKDIKITAKSIKTSKLTKRVFGLEGEIALKNMKRNKRHYRSLIFSLFISVVLFITVAAYIHYMKSAFSMAKDESNYDVRINSMIVTNQEMGEIAEDLRQYDSVDQAAVSYTWGGYMGSGNSNIVNDTYAKYIKDNYEEEYTPYFTILALDDTTFDSYCTSLGEEPSKYKNADNLQGILLNYLSIRANYTVQTYEPLNVKAGDTLSLENGIEFAEQPKHVKVEIGKVTKELPLGTAGYGSYAFDNLEIVVPDSTLKALAAKENVTIEEHNVILYLKAKDKEEIGKDISAVMSGYDYAEHDYDAYNIHEYEKTTRQLLLALAIFSYGFIIMMSLICCANMCNTISTSILLRRKEFSMLRSIGMTPRVFRRMIMYESLLYGVKALLYGIPVGLLFAFGIYRTMVDTFSVGFALPISIFVVVIILVFAVVGLAMFYSSRKVRKESIIDGLKEEIL